MLIQYGPTALGNTDAFLQTNVWRLGEENRPYHLFVYAEYFSKSLVKSL